MSIQIDWTLLLQLLPTIVVTLIALFLMLLKLWDPIRNFSGALWETLKRLKQFLDLRVKLNPDIERAFKGAKDEPLLKVYKDFIPLILEINRSADRVTVTLKPGMGVGKVQSIDLDSVIEAIFIHVRENLSRTSAVKDLKKLQEGIDLLAVKLVADRMRLDGALRIALCKRLSIYLKDKQVECRYRTLKLVNKEMKLLSMPMSREYLRILLTELEGWGFLDV